MMHALFNPNTSNSDGHFLKPFRPAPIYPDPPIPSPSPINNGPVSKQLLKCLSMTIVLTLIINIFLNLTWDYIYCHFVNFYDKNNLAYGTDATYFINEFTCLLSIFYIFFNYNNTHQQLSFRLSSLAVFLINIVINISLRCWLLTHKTLGDTFIKFI